MAGKLARLAQVMRTHVERSEGHKALWRRLERGLILVLERDSNGRWRLALGRYDTFPSPEEIRICQAAFAVPAGTSAPLRMHQRLDRETGKVNRYYVAEMFWFEREVTCG
jgi:hypothetical protein